jgi:hypothetical protein
MNKRQAKSTAHSIVRNLIESYFAVGQPGTGMGCKDMDCDESCPKCTDGARVHDALEQIRDAHHSKAEDFRETALGFLDETSP